MSELQHQENQPWCVCTRPILDFVVIYKTAPSPTTHTAKKKKKSSSSRDRIHSLCQGLFIDVAVSLRLISCDDCCRFLWRSDIRVLLYSPLMGCVYAHGSQTQHAWHHKKANKEWWSNQGSAGSVTGTETENCWLVTTLAWTPNLN